MSNQNLPPPVADCACGATYTEHDWNALRFVGYSVNFPDAEHPDDLALEMRDCRCGSTIARETTVAGTLTRFELRLATLEGAS